MSNGYFTFDVTDKNGKTHPLKIKMSFFRDVLNNGTRVILEYHNNDKQCFSEVLISDDRLDDQIYVSEVIKRKVEYDLFDVQGGKV